LILGSRCLASWGTLGANNGMIITNGSGELRKLFTFSFAYLFPVGTSATEYSPVSLNFTSGVYAAGAYVESKLRIQGLPIMQIQQIILKRHWIITTSGITNPVY
jgi:hypothetical protein